MPIQVPSYAGDPTSSAPVVNAYVQVIDFRFSMLTQTISFIVGYFRSQADYAARLKPMSQAVYSIGPNPETRSDGAMIPAFATVVGTAVTLSSDPAGTLAFTLVQRSVETFLFSLPEFAGATEVS